MTISRAPQRRSETQKLGRRSKAVGWEARSKKEVLIGLMVLMKMWLQEGAGQRGSLLNAGRGKRILYRVKDIHRKEQRKEGRPSPKREKRKGKV